MTRFISTIVTACVLVTAIGSPRVAAFSQADSSFIVVAPRAFADALEPFIAFKSLQMPTELVALEWILESSDGADDPEKLKRYLHEQWRTRGTRYALLVGDADVMPVRYAVTDRSVRNAFNYAFYPSDLYYADLARPDGLFDAWNAQHDDFHAAYIGEVRGQWNKNDPINYDDIDYRPDIAVGRWPVSTRQQVDTLVAKSIAHEQSLQSRSADDQPAAGMIACGGWIENRRMMDRAAAHLGDAWAISRRYYKDDTRDDDTPPPDAAQVIALMNGGVDLILHSGHGTTNGWHGSLDVKHLPKLEQASRLPVIFSAGCSTAQFASLGPYSDYLDVNGIEQQGTNGGAVFRAPPPPPSPYQTGRFNRTGLGERLLRDGPGGAIAYIGCNTGSQPCGMTLLDGFARAAGTLEEPRLGDCWSAAVAHYYEAEHLATIEPTESWYPCSIFFQAMKFMVFGDPTLPIGAPRRTQEAVQDVAADKGVAAVAPEDITALIEPIHAKHKVPSLAAAAVRGRELVAIGATGVRKARSETAVTTDDVFHIGSCTKSMTATVAAMLIEEGVLTWDITIAEALPDLAPNMHEQYRTVTLRMLLAHRSGLPEDRSPEPKMWRRVRGLSGPIHQQRLEASAIALEVEPVARPGEAMNYSNFGYIIAGTMLEELTGKTWEELMRTRLFEPLGMDSAGFGPPGGVENIDPDAPAQPWGHVGEVERLATIRPGPFADNPPLLGPAGTVHCDIADFAKYASFHLTRGEGLNILKPESFDVLHEPLIGGNYALGWGIHERGWADGTVWTHAGSNGMWYAVMWIAPKINMAFVSASNIAGQAGPAATDEAIAAMILHLPAADDADDQ